MKDSDCPLVTIITTTFNSEAFLEQTMRSVLDQDYSNLEYLIIDGGSKDRTLEIANSFNDSRVNILSEPDQGIADAMNKGIRFAKGSIIGIIHSDDTYLPGAVTRVVREMKAQSCAWLYGQIEYRNRENTALYRAGRPYQWKRMRSFMVVTHPSVFCMKTLYQRLGLFNLKYRLAMDYDLCLRFAIDSPPGYVSEPLATMRLGGASSRNLSSELRVAREVFEIKRNVLGEALHPYFYMRWSQLKTLVRYGLLKVPFGRECISRMRSTVNPNYITASSIEEKCSRLG